MIVTKKSMLPSSPPVRARLAGSPTASAYCCQKEALNLTFGKNVKTMSRRSKKPLGFYSRSVASHWNLLGLNGKGFYTEVASKEVV